MIQLSRAALVGAALSLAVGPSWAQTQIVYPAKGQSEQKQAHDERDCSAWATKRSGFNPDTTPAPTQVEAKKVTGSGARLVGAGAGGVVAGVAGGDVGAGLIVGGVTGGVVKRVKSRREARKINDARNAQYNAARTEWTTARATCLTGRGYTVK